MATRTISTRISLDGEKEFKQQMSSVNSELKTLKSEMTLVDAEFKGQANSMEALTAKGRVLADQIEQQKEKVAALETAYRDSAEAFGENSTKTDGYLQSLNNARAELLRLTDAQEQNNKYLDEAASSSDGCAKSIDEFGNAVKESGEKSRTFGDLVKANLTSAAIISGIKALASAFREVGQASVQLLTDTAELADNIDKASQRAGVSAEEYQKWAHAASMSGIEASTLESLMIKQQKSFADAKEGSSSLCEAYQRLGIDIRNISNSGDAFNAVIAALADMEDETTRNAIANDLFGKTYAELTPLLAEGSEGIEALKQDLVDLGGVMSDEAVKAGAAFGDSLDRLKTAFSGLKNNLSAEFLPSVTTVMDGFTLMLSGNMDEGAALIEQGLDEFGETLDRLGPYAEQALEHFAEAITDSLPEIMECAGEVVLTLADGLLQAIPELAPVAGEMIGTFVANLITHAPELLEAAGTLLYSLVSGLDAGIAPLVEQGLKLLGAVKDGVLSGVSQLREAGRNLIEGLWNGINDSVAWLKSKVAGVVNKIKSWFTGSEGFDTHSPSKWSENVFKNLMEGGGLGIDSGAEDLYGRVDDVVGGIKRRFATDIPSNVEVAARFRSVPGGVADVLTSLGLSGGTQLQGELLPITIIVRSELDGRTVAEEVTAIQAQIKRAGGRA